MHNPMSISADPFLAARVEMLRRIAWHTVRGATVVHQDDSITVLAYRRRTNHPAHLVATICTLGLWGPVWAVYSAAPPHERRVRVMVDKYGLVHEESARRKNERYPASRAGQAEA